MESVAFEALEPALATEEATRYELSAPLGTTHVAINRFRIEPDGGLPSGLHAHMDQEEVFVVTAGTLTFERLDGSVRVARGEAIRIAPGEFQSGRNRGDRPATVLAIGAPKDSTDVRIPVECPTCEFHNLRLEHDRDGLTFVCPECSATHLPAPCPQCGGDDLRVEATGGGGTVVRCHHCDERFDRPPIEA